MSEKKLEGAGLRGQVAGKTEVDIAEAMASEIRKEAPISTLTGAAIFKISLISTGICEAALKPNSSSAFIDEPLNYPKS